MVLPSHTEPVNKAVPARRDPDRIIAGYRAARTQWALFEPGGGSEAAFDEFIDQTGAVRPGWADLAEALGERGRAGLDQLRSMVAGLVENDGITYIPMGDSGGQERSDSGMGPGGQERSDSGSGPGGQARSDPGSGPGGQERSAAEPGLWRLDGLPLLVSAEDWEVLELGLVQRSRLLDAVDRGSFWSTPTGPRRHRVPAMRWPTVGWSRTRCPISTNRSPRDRRLRSPRHCGWP